MQDMTPELRFGVQVRYLRQQMGLTQTELAQRLADEGLKLDPSAFARIEKGGRSIRLNEAVAMASALGTTVEAMVPPPAPLDEQILRAEREYAAAGQRLAALRKTAGVPDQQEPERVLSPRQAEEFHKLVEFLRNVRPPLVEG